MNEAEYLYEKENLDHYSLKHMLERMRSQRSYEIAIMRELDPYFKFQTQIYGTLEGISQGQDHR